MEDSDMLAAGVYCPDCSSDNIMDVIDYFRCLDCYYTFEVNDED